MVTLPDPVIIPTDPEERRMIASASNERLKVIRDAMLGKMDTLIHGRSTPRSPGLRRLFNLGNIFRGDRSRLLR
jgi:hypothetical protein